MRRRTIVVDGPLAYKMRRYAAARDHEHGLQVLSMPMLAARLAGGFCRPADGIALDPAIRAALELGGFSELDQIRELPGMRRASARTLSRMWNSDLHLASIVAQTNRSADLQSIESRVRASLSLGVLTPQDLRDAAISRVEHAERVLGAVTFDRLHSVERVWRPLVVALCGVIDVTWENPAAEDWSWFPGKVIHVDMSPVRPLSVSCANPRAEAVEALRWARELIVSGRARPEEIAICAPDPSDWDDHFVALSGDDSVPLHFSHGVPALSSWDGQFCAALADAMLNGLTQDRLRRLFGYAAGRSDALRGLPRDWARGLPSSAVLMELDQWRQCLLQLESERTDSVGLNAMLQPVLEQIAAGPAAAEELAKLLPPSAQNLWNEALRSAPAAAMNLSLKQVKIADSRNPETCAVWAPASHLANAPRPWVRLLGLTSKSWPRPVRDDSLAPNHVVPRNELVPDNVSQRDQRAFATILAWAGGGCVLSRSRRSSQGARLAGSPLVDSYGTATLLRAARVPEHAFSEADRLVANPEEAATSSQVSAASTCWRNWASKSITPHDGNSRKEHPQILRALAGVHSATSLQRMLRDPMAYVWRYALGWHSAIAEDQPLELTAQQFGELVHSLLRLTVDHLEPTPGYTLASRGELEAAMGLAMTTILEQWPLARAVPPRLLWQHTLQFAGKLALRALTDDVVMPSTRSWTEVPFGVAEPSAATHAAPWDTSTKVLLPGTDIHITGSIDRLDLKEDGRAIRVTDYKTGELPKTAPNIVLAGGTELQRVIYAIAAEALLPGPPRVVARLLYLKPTPPQEFKLGSVSAAIESVAAAVTDSAALLRKGVFLLVGPDLHDDWNEYRLMRPASQTYLQRKNFAFGSQYGSMRRHWSGT